MRIRGLGKFAGLGVFFFSGFLTSIESAEADLRSCFVSSGAWVNSSSQCFRGCIRSFNLFNESTQAKDCEVHCMEQRIKQEGLTRCGGSRQSPSSTKLASPAQTPSSCSGSECSAQAADWNQRGAREAQSERLQQEKVFADAGSLKEERILQSKILLEEWKQARGGMSQMSPQERVAFSQDQMLVQQAEKSFRAGKPFKPSEADKANSRQIRQNLQSAAEAQQVQNELKAEIIQLKTMESEFRALASKNAGKAETMRSLNRESAGPGGGLGSASIMAQSSKEGSGTHPSDGSVSNQSLPNEMGEKAEQADSEAHNPKALLTLRNELRARLAGKKAEGVDDKGLQGDADSPSTRDAVQGSGESGSGEPNRDLAETVKAAFSLAGVETDAEVRRLRADAERLLQRDWERSELGILEENSSTLFERVHLAHEQCVRRLCVMADPP
jgi:hypothetical protein